MSDQLQSKALFILQESVPDCLLKAFQAENTRRGKVILPHKAENTDYLSEDLEWLVRLYDNRLHRIIFRLEADMSVFFVKSFYCGRVIDQGYHFPQWAVAPQLHSLH